MGIRAFVNTCVNTCIHLNAFEYTYIHTCNGAHT